MYIQVEDEFGDIVGKARRGQEIAAAELARRVQLSQSELQKIEDYELTPDQTTVERLATELGLHPQKLQNSAAKRYFPLYPSGRPVDGLVVEMMILGKDFLMNGYIVGCTETSRGVVIDPGFEAEKILKTIEAMDLEIEQVLLTHGHEDHIGALSEICQATECPALVNKADLPLLGGLSSKIESSISEGETISVGNQEFLVQATPGHTPGGVSLVHAQVAIVGDALFAGSLGGTKNRGDYESQRQAVGEKILGLDDRVVLYPGHGPATTVGEEKGNNPFFL
jgi:glyoxylase-like metal-dependent hydrolase (beta-lactamase superfamily II)